MENDSDIYQYPSEPSQRYGYSDGEAFDFQTLQEDHRDAKDSDLVHSDMDENLNKDLENGGLSNGIKTLNRTTSNNTINNNNNYNYNSTIKNINNNSINPNNNTSNINSTNNYNNNNVNSTVNSTDYESIFALNSFGLPSSAFFGASDPSNIVYRPNNMISNLESPENFSGVDFDHSGENQNQANVSFSMPGAFHNGDNMDLDESPPFTIESETYYDPQIESTSIKHETESLFKANGNTNANVNLGSTLLAPQQRTPTQRIESSFSPFDNSSRVSSFRIENGNGLNPNGAFVFNHVTTNVDNGVNQKGPVLGSVDNYYSNLNGNGNANTNGITNDSNNNKNGNDSIKNNGNGSGKFNNSNINNTTSNSNNTNSVYNTSNGNYLSVHSNLAGNAFSNASLGQNSNNFYNELSPITTTTSLTPSISSVHSTQPSFFSAHQFLTRNSLDQGPPTHLVSSSFDLFNKGRPSMESQQSSSRRNPSSGRYTSFTNSLTNMIPFMGDRNQRSPISGPPSPQSQNSSSFIPQPPPQHSRHLIRSIFKSNTATSNNVQAANEELTNAFVIDESSDPFVSGSGNAEDFLMMSPTKEEPELEAIDASVQQKKAKRSKRSLFTRFKAPTVKQEPIDENEMLIIDDFAVKEGDNLDNSTSTSGPFQPTSISRTPSTATGNFLDSASSSSTSHNQSQSQLLPQPQAQSLNSQSQEPDYASLFENVGKRKIVNTSSYRKSKTKLKNEDGTTSNNSNSTIENSPVLNVSLGSKKLKTDSEVGSGNNSGHTTEKSSLHNLRLSHQRSNQSSGNNISIKEEYSERGSVADMSVKSNTSKENRLRPQSSEEVDISDDESTTSTTSTSNFATASKRILGSKLMKKKSSPVKMPVATVINKGVEVEVDLKSLDLPPNTQIFPTSIINSKNRTRGRKENKEADMVDSTKIYLCNYCSRRFKRQEHLKRHFRSLHTFEKPYDCTICNKKFSRSDNLNQHLKIHKQEEEAAALERELMEQGTMAETKLEDEPME